MKAENIFEVPDTVAASSSATSSTEVAAEATIPNVSALRVKSYELTSLTAQYPGWTAIYDDTENDGEIVMFPICAIGSVLVSYENGTQQEIVRHFVSLPTGVIRDIAEIDNFVCVVAPGQNIENVVAAIKAEQKGTMQ